MHPNTPVAPGKRPQRKQRRSSEEPGDTTRRQRTAGADANGSFEDLCSTCNKREHCRYPRPSGGVWHCVGYC